MKNNKKLQFAEITLFYLNKELKDEMHYKDIIFIKGKNIECRLIFTFICTDKSAIKFDNFKEIIDEETTVNDCRKKCLEKINSSKCRNIKRILLNVQNMEIKFKQIFNSI